MTKQFSFIFAAWLCALLATSGSLFFSEAMQFIPCTLCWYQRIAMYPLVLLLGLGLWHKQNNTALFTLPLAILGWLLAFYHLGVQHEIIPEAASPCVQGIPCSSMYINWLGFITIPTLSLIAFSLIIALLWKSHYEKH